MGGSSAHARTGVARWLREPGGTMTQNELEIRLLGPLRVRRSDGTEVDPREWRTGKTADLLRLLAVRSGQPVPVDTILEALWPRVDPQEGLASPRTAGSQ